MASEPVLSGEIPSDGILEVLRELELRRITGKIRFVVGEESGEVELVLGQLAMDQDPLPNGADPVEALLQARAGLYTVHAILPPLPISHGDGSERHGSLSVHVPSDLMTYCEQAGLTGVLELRNEGRVAEMVYEAGELLCIRLDGREETDLDAVFAWDAGNFRVVMQTDEEVHSRVPPSLAPRSRPPASERASAPARREASERDPTIRYERPATRPSEEPAPASDGGPTSRYAKVSAGREDTGKNFLRVVEMALTDVTSAREKARPSTLATAVPKKARPSMRPAPARPPRAKDATVRIVWVGGEPAIEGEAPARRSAPARAKEESAPARAKEESARSERASSEPRPREAEASGEARRAPTSAPRTAPSASADEAPASSPLTFVLVAALLVALSWLAWTYLGH